MAIHIDEAEQHPQVRALYEAIGRFVVEFEQAGHAMQVCITLILWKAGLHDQRLSQIVLAGLTAEPLRSLFESVVGQQIKLTELERKMMKNATTRFQDLISERNDVIHATWFIGWGDGPTDDFSTASGRKLHKNKEGAAPKSFSHKVEDFATLSAEARALQEIFQRLNFCFLGGASIEKNFIFLENGALSVPPGVGNVLKM